MSVYKIFSAVSFFYIYLLVFSSSVYIYLPCIDEFCHLSEFFLSWSPKPGITLIRIRNGIQYCKFRFHGSHFNVFAMSFLSIRYDLLEFTHYLGDLLYEASGWTKWTSLSLIIMIIMIIIWRLWWKGLQSYFLFSFKWKVTPSGVARNQVEFPHAKVEGCGPWTIANLKLPPTYCILDYWRCNTYWWQTIFLQLLPFGKSKLLFGD